MTRKPIKNSAQSLHQKRFLKQTQNAFRNLAFIGLILITMFYIPLSMANQSMANQTGITAFEQNDLLQAKKLFKQDLTKDNKNAIALHYLAKIALRERELDAAEEYIQKAQNLIPMNAEIQFDIGKIMGEQAGEAGIFGASGYMKKTIKAYKKAAELEPGTLLYRQRLMTIYLMAPGFLGGDEELAMVEAKAIAEIDEVQGLLAMAIIYQNSGEEDKLEILYTSAQQKYPNNPHIFYSRGKYYQSQEKFNLAINDFKKIQTLQAENEQDTKLYAALYEIGRSSLLSNSYLDDGISALQSFIDSAPYDESRPRAWAKYRLGLLLAKNGDQQKAHMLYQQAKVETQDKTLLNNLKKELRK